MMKKVLYMLVVALMFSFVFSFAMADDDAGIAIGESAGEMTVEPIVIDEEMLAPLATCSHDEYQLIGDPSQVTPTTMKYDKVNHRVAKVMTAICMKKSCQKKITVYVNMQYIPHTFSDNGGAHVEGSVIHRYNQICHECGETSYYEMFCLDCE